MLFLCTDDEDKLWHGPGVLPTAGHQGQDAGLLLLPSQVFSHRAAPTGCGAAASQRGVLQCGQVNHVFTLAFYIVKFVYILVIERFLIVQWLWLFKAKHDACFEWNVLLHFESCLLPLKPVMLGWCLLWLTGEVRSQEADLPHNQYEQRASVTDVAIDLIGLSLGPTLAAGGKFPSGIGFSFPLNFIFIVWIL